MNSEKVKEIKKALEQNIKSGLGYEDNNKFCNIMFADILTLINELEKENGELKQHITEVEKGIINIARERNKKEELASKFIDCYNDSLKQFAERLKDKIVNTPHILGGERTIIDETLKEFINERD